MFTLSKKYSESSTEMFVQMFSVKLFRPLWKFVRRRKRFEENMFMKCFKENMFMKCFEKFI